MSDTLSNEYKTFRGAYSKLSQGITHPELIAGMLWSNDFITAIERQKAEQISIPAYQRTIELLNTVCKKIELQPEKLGEFVKILESERSLVYLARLLDPSAQSPQQATQAENIGSTRDFSEAKMKEWFKRIGLNDKDTALLIDEGFGTGPGFMELTKEDVDEMTFSRGAKKVLYRVISGNSRPVPMDTTPPSNAIYPVPRPARVEAQGGPPPPFVETPPPEPKTVDSIAEEVGLAPYALDTEFSDNYSVILAFAKLMPDWKPIAQCLYLSAQDIRAIETNVSLNFLMQCTETIKKWKSRFGFKAKYRMLVEAMLANKEEKIAFQFCRLVLRVTGPQAQPRQPRQTAPRVCIELTLDSVIDALRPLTLSRSNNGQLSRGLGVSDYKLSEFEANNYYDIAQVRTELLKEWLRNEYPPTWKKLAAAVRKTGDGNLAWRLDAYQAPHEYHPD